MSQLREQRGITLPHLNVFPLPFGLKKTWPLLGNPGITWKKNIQFMEGVTKQSHLSPKEAAIQLPNRSRICVGISELERWANDGSPIQTVSETTSWLFMSTSNDMVDLLQLHVDLTQITCFIPMTYWKYEQWAKRNHQYQRTVVHGHKTRMWAAQGCQRHLEWSQRKQNFMCPRAGDIGR